MVTLGTFDGVHLGHQAVIRSTVDWARERGGESVVLTFDRHPRRVIRGEAPGLITSVEHRLVLFEQLGVDVCVVLKFDAALADMEPEVFVQRILVDWIAARGIMLGYDSAFGKGGRGDLSLLRSLGETHGFDALTCAAVELDGEVVSSTTIREAIEGGDLAGASRMLGRPFSLLGTVVHGSGLGRSLGFPTANLDLHHEARPPRGVYLTQAIIAGHVMPSLTSIGSRPTLHREPEAGTVVEVYIEGCDRSLYGEEVEVQFVQKLREEVAFGSAEALVEQMQKDRQAMLRALAHLLD